MEDPSSFLDPNLNLLHNPRRFDIFEYLSSAGLASQASLEDKSVSVFKHIDVALDQDRILIGKGLGMTKKDENTWIGTFTIENLTRINMSYVVFASELSVHLDPEANWIGPKGISKITVLVSNKIIKKFFNSGKITILTTPVYKKDQLNQTINTPFASTFFSYSLEPHDLTKIYSKNYDQDGNWTILDILYAGQGILLGKSQDKLVLPENKFRIPCWEESYSSEVSQLVEKHETERQIVQSMKRKENQRSMLKKNHLLLRQIMTFLVIFNVAGFFMQDGINYLLKNCFTALTPNQNSWFRRWF